MFENRAIKLINWQLSWLNSQFNVFTRFYALLCAFTRFYALLRAFLSVKQFSVFTRFYALLSQLSSLSVYSVYSLLRLLPILETRETMLFKNHAIKVIYRQLSLLTGNLTCLRAFSVTQF